MLSKENKLYLAQLVNERKDILFPLFSVKLTNQVKVAAWEDIRIALMARGAVIKDAKFLRDWEWSNLSRQVVGRYRKSLKTGQDGSSLSQLDNIVLDIESRDSVNVKALNIPDNKVVFGKTPKNFSTSALELDGTTVEADDIPFIFSDLFESPELTASQISNDASLYAAEVEKQKDDPKKIKSSKNRNLTQSFVSADGYSFHGSSSRILPLMSGLSNFGSTTMSGSSGPSSHNVLPGISSFTLTATSGPSGLVVTPMPGAPSSRPSNPASSESLQPTNKEEEPNSRRKKGKKKESVLSDMSFIESKKLKLEIDSLEMKTERQKEREALELDLLRSKIAEVNSRKEFFETLTFVIKKKNSFAFIESLYEEIED